MSTVQGENTDNVDFRAGTAEMENRVMAIAAGSENVNGNYICSCTRHNC